MIVRTWYLSVFRLNLKTKEYFPMYFIVLHNSNSRKQIYDMKYFENKK